MKSVKAKVISCEKLNSKFLLLNFQVEEDFSYVAGQWVSLDIGGGEIRSYSVASAPKSNGQIEMLVDVEPQGEGSRYVMGLCEGSQVKLIGPFGEFVLKKGDKKRLLVATGSGIAPVRAMWQSMVESKDDIETVLLWGLRYEENVALGEELEKVQKEMRGFRYIVSLSQPEDGWQGSVGRVTDRVEEMEDLSEWSVYICGGREMVGQVEKLVLAKGANQTRIYYEKFY